MAKSGFSGCFSLFLLLLAEDLVRGGKTKAAEGEEGDRFNKDAGWCLIFRSERVVVHGDAQRCRAEEAAEALHRWFCSFVMEQC